MNDQSRERFSNRSLKQIETLHKDLQDICEVAVTLLPFSVIEGHRGKCEQERMNKEGISKVEYPNSKHNSLPSKAMDLVVCIGLPYPSNDAWEYLANIIKFVGKTMSVNIVWGGDWKENPDRYHFELQESVAEIIDETKLSMDR